MADFPLRISNLTADQIEQAYALIELCFPHMPLADWRRVAAELLNPSPDMGEASGIVAAVNHVGCLRGIFIYQSERKILHGHQLMVSHLAIPMFGQRRVAELLGDEMIRTAQTHCCDRIHIEIVPDSEWQLAFFSKRGYEIEAVRLTRTI